MRFEDNIYGSPIATFLSGAFAVSTFFVLSGFVLSIGYFQTKKDSIVKKMAAKRYLRLMLPALASIVVCYCIISVGISHVAQLQGVTGSAWLNVWGFEPHIISALQSGVLGIFVDGSNPYNGVLWTMTTEFLGSFLVFGFLLLFGASRNRWIAYPLLIAITASTWYSAFIIGMLLADLYANGKITQRKRNLAASFVLAGAGIYFGGFPDGQLSGTAYAWMAGVQVAIPYIKIVFLTVGSAAIIFLVLRTAGLARILRRQSFSVLGKYTFSMYLMHLPVIYTISAAVFLWAHQSLQYNQSVLVAAVVSLPVLVFVVFLFNRFVDIPAVKLSNMFAQWFNSDLKSAQSLWRSGVIKQKLKPIGKAFVKNIQSGMGLNLENTPPKVKADDLAAR